MSKENKIFKKLTPKQLVLKKAWEKRQTLKKQQIRKELKVKNLPNERWFDLINYKGIYQISSFLRVKGLARFIPYRKYKHDGEKFVSEKLLHIFYPKNHYPRLILSKDGIKRTEGVHRLVATMFIPNPENKPEVNHINGNKLDFSIPNLEWATKIENEQHSWSVLGKKAKKGEDNVGCKLTYKQVCEIREKHKLFHTLYSAKSLSKKYNISASRITNIVNNKVRLYA